MIDYGVATLPMPGESESGDGYLLKEYSGSVLVAVVDGLGHGPEAALAMRAAIATLEFHGHESLTSLIQQCHQRLRDTRGAVMSIASLDRGQGTMTWLGVGNVLGVLFHPAPDQGYRQTFLVSRTGVVGQNLPALQAMTVSINPGDTLVFATDGVSQEFPQGTDPTTPPHQLAEQILNDYALNTDDAMVLVVRYRGVANES